MKKLFLLIIVLSVVFTVACSNKISEHSVETDDVIEYTEKPERTVEITISKKELAVESAKNHLNVIAFSREGLFTQLKYEGFSESEAEYGVNNCNADWNKQAYRCALDYLAVEALDSEAIKSQLKFEGFLDSEIEYAISRLY